jgi:hypothetical protein
LFTRHGQDKTISEWVNDLIIEGGFEFLVAPLKERRSIQSNTEKWVAQRIVAPHYGPLNRHGVLHGIDLDYPTESNSLRAILLMIYLLDMTEFLRHTIDLGASESP